MWLKNRFYAWPKELVLFWSTWILISVPCLIKTKMIYGYDKLVKTFKDLSLKDNLSHGYIFFGESEIGKATFARCLANFMEFGEFTESNHVLTECLNIKPDFKESDGIIGIDAIRDIKQFLYALPVNSKRRIVLIQDAEALTAQAENAILKIAEEPPKSGL